ncbi:secretory pathway Sec39 [Xylariaceae sp. FL1019]|nr:secretory pathway Sec39 [Xylariaceae sp. FL1019]
MTASLSPAQVVLLAANFASKADVQSLTTLAQHHPNVLRPDLVLRILLTCLPERLPSSDYAGIIHAIQSETLYSDPHPSSEIDPSSIDDISDREAARKIKKLRLIPLAWHGAPEEALDDPVSLFLIHRAHRIDQEIGELAELPSLIVPFLRYSPCIRTWMISSLLPLLRRNHEYYPETPIPYTLEAFENLDSGVAVASLLSQTGARPEDLQYVGRDLRGLIGPWLYNDARWNQSQQDGHSGHLSCPAWEHVLEWLTAQSSTSWKVAVKAIEQWDGPSDVDLGGYESTWLGDDEQGHLEQRYARAAMASAYLISEASTDALSGANSILTKIMGLIDLDPCQPLQMAASMLSPFVIPDADDGGIFSHRSASLLRNDLLGEANYLTTPNNQSTQLLHTLILSAFILTKAGTPCTIRRAGELAFLQDEREQKDEAMRFIRSLSFSGPKNDDKYWIRARNELLWLRDWGAEEAGLSGPHVHGVFNLLNKEFLEIECLKAFLSNTRYSLARAIYEDSPDKASDEDVLRDTIVTTAMEAYDNATNPHRGRGGLLKCDDIIHAFPATLPQTHPASRRIEALLKATHALGEYRLVLKKGEPFTPVVLRVHTDPISIIGKVLEQNPKSYTNIQDFLEIGSNMIAADLVTNAKTTHPSPSSKGSIDQRSLTQRRITAMCIDAALNEDDFETAYSYVVNRLSSDSTAFQPADDYSWKAALQAGKYRRTGKTLRPTHIGTASGNMDIRHLEQRIECLSTALRIAPAATLQEILNVFRKCEEELNAAVKADEAQESAWDDQGDMQTMPGAFSSTVPAGVVRSGARQPRQAEEAPMSLFDLSRATMARAQTNLSALSSLQRSERDREGEEGEPRTRKRDQLREAAVGTLASGVGWLIGAQPVDRSQERE